MNIKQKSLSLLLLLSLNRLVCMEVQIEGQPDSNEFEEISKKEVVGLSITQGSLARLFVKIFNRMPRKYHNLNLFLKGSDYGISLDQALLGNREFCDFLSKNKDYIIPDFILKKYTRNDYQKEQINSAFKNFIAGLISVAKKEEEILKIIKVGKPTALLSLFLQGKINYRLISSLKENYTDENDNLILEVAIELRELYGYGCNFCESCAIL